MTSAQNACGARFVDAVIATSASQHEAYTPLTGATENAVAEKSRRSHSTPANDVLVADERQGLPALVRRMASALDEGQSVSEEVVAELRTPMDRCMRSRQSNRSELAC